MSRPPNKILNPATNRYVNIDSVIGKKLTRSKSPKHNNELSIIYY